MPFQDKTYEQYYTPKREHPVVPLRGKAVDLHVADRSAREVLAELYGIEMVKFFYLTMRGKEVANEYVFTFDDLGGPPFRVCARLLGGVADQGGGGGVDQWG